MDGQYEGYKYTDEISKMLFGFGDSSKPNENTVHLVESIVYNQIRSIIREALKYSDNETLNGRELVFLMRHNKYKMRRFIRYLRNKEMSKEIAKDTDTKKEEVPNKEIKKEIDTRVLLDFIEYIDQTGELTDLSEFDEVKHARQIRANEISLVLDKKKYAEYQKARTVSFHSDIEKFRQWINPKKEIHLTATALDVLAYYAFETIAQLADFAFQVRLDNKKEPDPVNTFRKVYSVQQPFTVHEIKEVMRRVTSPQTGRLKFGKDLPERHTFLAL